MLTKKEHGRITTQKHRVNVLKAKCITDGFIYLALGIFGGYIARQFGIHTAEGFGWGQVAVSIYGAITIWWGWSIR